MEKRGGIIQGRPARWKTVSIDIRGIGTTFIFEKNCKIENLSIIDYGGKNTVIIGENSSLSGLIKIGRGCTLTIGRNFTATAALKLHLSETRNITIGDDCMFGININIYNHDYHPIFSIEDGSRQNHSLDVEIKNKVWLANNVTVLKGVTVEEGSVVGLGSLVISDVPKNSIAAGSPARVIKSGITWDRASLNTSHPDGIANQDEL